MAGDIVVANSVILNAQRQTMRNNQPLFSVGNNKIAGYVSTTMYDQVSGSEVRPNDPGNPNGSTYSVNPPDATQPSGTFAELYKGETLSSGQPYIIGESTTAINIVGDIVS